MAPHDTLRCAPGVSGPEALGASSLDELLEPERLPTFGRAEVIPSRADDLVLRLPLPGTPDEDGRQHERPVGSGTGYVYVRVYQPRFGTALRARLTEPRSASLAEREWNLSCLLRARGIATPDLMMVGTRGRGLVARRSVLVTRELSRFESFDRWVDLVSGPERELGLEALGRALDRLGRSGVALPELTPADVFVRRNTGACADDTTVPGSESPLRKLPGVAFANLRGGFVARDEADPRVRGAAVYLRTAVEARLAPEERERLAAAS